MRLMNLIALAVIAALPALPGCSAPPSASTSTPTLVVTYDAGMPADPKSQSSGVRLAVWEDGTVLAAADPLHPNRRMRVGRLTSDEAAAAWDAFEKSGFFSEPDIFLVAPDSEYVKITARSGGVTRTHTLDTYYQSQTAWWPRVEAAMGKFIPTETSGVTAAADNGVFRGYVIAEWWRTPWAR